MFGVTETTKAEIVLIIKQETSTKMCITAEEKLLPYLVIASLKYFSETLVMAFLESLTSVRGNFAPDLTFSCEMFEGVLPYSDCFKSQ